MDKTVFWKPKKMASLSRKEKCKSFAREEPRAQTRRSDFPIDGVGAWQPIFLRRWLLCATQPEPPLSSKTGGVMVLHTLTKGNQYTSLTSDSWPGDVSVSLSLQVIHCSALLCVNSFLFFTLHFFTLLYLWVLFLDPYPRVWTLRRDLNYVNKGIL